ncbi:MAG: hypothetical protein K2N01_13355 [Lachnospiraceae bacterium]|nr:hypothetical protein [Lachnospiraceae bacterium]
MAYIGLAHCVIRTKEGEGLRLGGAINVDITPQYGEGKNYADNKLETSRKVFKYADVKLETSRIPVKAAAAMFGNEYIEADRRLVSRTTDKAQEVGFGCYVDEDDGTYSAIWLPETTFTEPSSSFKTNGENVEFQNPSIDGTAKGNSDNEWKEVNSFDTIEEVESWLCEKAGITEQNNQEEGA